MTFRIIYVVKKEKREIIIKADSLDEAREIADKRYKNWIDIYNNEFQTKENWGK